MEHVFKAAEQNSSNTLNYPEEKEDQDDQKYQTESSAWIIAPSGAVGPCGQRADQ
jgi:hypothetical protein